MAFQTKTIFATDANGFQTLRQEIVDRAKAKDAIMNKISRGLEKETPEEINLAKLDFKAFIAEVRKQSVQGFRTQEGTKVLSASKQLIHAVLKEIDQKKSGLSFAKMSRKADKMDEVKKYMAEIGALEDYLKQLSDLTGFTHNYNYEYANGNTSFSL
ncbi:hypothetical protein CN327_25500 [Bacillus cereus]|nr:hypothetical protein CN327_25500 [Bacillus cereus]